MANLYQTCQKRDYDLNFAISEMKDRSSCRRFSFLTEPEKYLCFGESTYSDHFGPKTNFPPPCSEAPFSMPLIQERARHMVSTTQHDFDRRETGIHTDRLYRKGTKHQTEDPPVTSAFYSRESPEDILTTVGSIPLVKSCRQRQDWETTYNHDFEYFPPKERRYPFPRLDE